MCKRKLVNLIKQTTKNKLKASEKTNVVPAS